jgi:hypothetical protein
MGGFLRKWRGFQQLVRAKKSLESPLLLGLEAINEF